MIKRLGLSLFVISISLGYALAPAPAYARGIVSIGLGCCGYYPYYSPYYYGYHYYGYPAYYYAPAPTVVYTQPAPVTYVQPQIVTAPSVASAPMTSPVPVATAISAGQNTPTFIDSKGRTCRKFESSFNGAPVNGTACLQSDGTWRTVDE